MLKRILILTIAAAMTTLAMAQPAYATWLTGWGYRKKITIDYTKIDDTITSFPVRIYLNADGDIGAAARSDGFDIRFTEYNGVTLLKYEREDFAIATSQATGNFWVKIPAISSSADTEFYIYYGKSDATDGEDATNVWTNGQVGVWLAKEGSGITTADSTTNNNDGTLTGDTAWTTGQIDGALSFDGTGDSVDITDPSWSFNAVTISAWVYADAASAGYDFITYGGSDWAINFRHRFDQNTTQFLYGDGVNTDYVRGGHVLPTDEWLHMVISYEDGKGYFYKNGTLIISDTDEADYNATTQGNLQIGKSWQGKIDNVMIFDRALSAAEIKADYNSGNNSLLSLGAEETEAEYSPATVEMRGGVTLKQNVTIKTQ